MRRINLNTHTIVDLHFSGEKPDFSEIDEGIIIVPGWAGYGSYWAAQIAVPKDYYEDIVLRLKTHPDVLSINGKETDHADEVLARKEL